MTSFFQFTDLLNPEVSNAFGVQNKLLKGVTKSCVLPSSFKLKMLVGATANKTEWLRPAFTSFFNSHITSVQFDGRA